MSEPALLKNKKYNPFENLTHPGIICAFSVRVNGNMSLSYSDTKDSLLNRNNFLSALGIDYQSIICAQQVHSNNVKYVRQADKGKGALSYESSMPDTDGFITDEKNLPLSIFTADCLSIFLYDSQTPAIGLIHAGWLSSKENISSKAVKLMQREFNTKPEGLYAAFGPSIRSCCYEVSSDFNNFFTNGLTKRNGSYYFDLAKINKQELICLGVKSENIFDPEICTSCHNEELFSFRKEGNGCGRLMSVMMLK